MGLYLPSLMGSSKCYVSKHHLICEQASYNFQVYLFHVSFILAKKVQFHKNFHINKIHRSLGNKCLCLGFKNMSSATADVASGHGTQNLRFFSEQWSIRLGETYPHPPKICTCVTKIISSCFPLPIHLAFRPPPL